MNAWGAPWGLPSPGGSTCACIEFLPWNAFVLSMVVVEVWIGTESEVQNGAMPCSKSSQRMSPMQHPVGMIASLQPPPLASIGPASSPSLAASGADGGPSSPPSDFTSQQLAVAAPATAVKVSKARLIRGHSWNVEQPTRLLEMMISSIHTSCPTVGVNGPVDSFCQPNSSPHTGSGLVVVTMSESCVP